MIITKFFEKANISSHKGGLEIDAKYISMESKHYNVSVTIDTEQNLCTVTGDRPEYFINIGGLRDRVLDINEVVDRHIEICKIFPWSVGFKRIIKGWVELKKQTSLTYTSNRFVIIE